MTLRTKLFLWLLLFGLIQFSLGELTMWIKMKQREKHFVKLIKEKLKEKGIEEL